MPCPSQVVLSDGVDGSTQSASQCAIMVVSEIYIEKEPSTIDITTLGIDLAKSVFSFMALQNGGVHIRPHMTRPIY
jgi:hypothetical protein